MDDLLAKLEAAADAFDRARGDETGTGQRRAAAEALSVVVEELRAARPDAGRSRVVLLELLGALDDLDNGKRQPLTTPCTRRASTEAASEDQIEAVERLRKNGLSLRDIAATTGLGLDTVRAILKVGGRPLSPAKQSADRAAAAAAMTLLMQAGDSEDSAARQAARELGEPALDWQKLRDWRRALLKERTRRDAVEAYYFMLNTAGETPPADAARIVLDFVREQSGGRKGNNPG